MNMAGSSATENAERIAVLYAEMATRTQACEQLRQADSSVRLEVIQMFKARLGRNNLQQIGFMILMAAVVFASIPLFVSHRFPQSTNSGIAIGEVLLVFAIWALANTRLNRPVVVGRGMVCELVGPEIVAPMLGWIMNTRGPFPPFGDLRVNAHKCLARNLPFMKGREDEVGVFGQLYLLNLAVSMAKGTVEEPWQWDYVQAVLSLAPAFRNQNAVNKIQDALARGTFHSPR